LECRAHAALTPTNFFEEALDASRIQPRTVIAGCAQREKCARIASAPKVIEAAGEGSRRRPRLAREPDASVPSDTADVRQRERLSSGRLLEAANSSRGDREQQLVVFAAAERERQALLLLQPP